MNKAYSVLLVESGLRKVDLSRELGVHKVTVSRWRDGRVPEYVVAWLRCYVECARLREKVGVCEAFEGEGP